MDIIAWIKSLFSGAPLKRNPAQRGITRATDKREAAAHGKAQADYEKRRALKKRGKS